MARKARKLTREFKFDPYDDFDDIYDDDFDAKVLTRDSHSTEWSKDDHSDWNGHGSARRKIERRNEMKKLYSELNDWEEYGESDSNFMY